MSKYKGQHLYVKKAAGSYTHHGLGLGNGRVIHYSGLANDLTTPGVVEEIDIEAFGDESEIIIKPHLDREFNTEEAIIRACLRLGEAQYHILHNNCEHFVEWCISGEHRSQQSKNGKLIYSAGVGVRTLLGAKNPVGFVAGAVAGYAYISRQGKKMRPDFAALEAEYQRIVSFRKALGLYPYDINFQLIESTKM